MMQSELLEIASWPMLIALTAVGAALGGLTRYTLSATMLPYKGTLAANILGSISLGMAVGGLFDHSIWYLAALGFAGALSTWSTLAAEVVALAQRPAQVTMNTRDRITPVAMAVGYLLLTVASGIVGALIGLHL